MRPTIASRERQCQRIARQRNEAARQQASLSESDPNFWVLADVIDSLEIRFGQAQQDLHNAQADERLRRKLGTDNG